MEEKLEEELVAKFKSIEKKLTFSIKKLPQKIQDSNDSFIVKQRIKTYIEKINELKLLLLEYEEIALEIEKLSNKKNGEEISKAVVSLRENVNEANAKVAEEIAKEFEIDNAKKNEKDEEIIVDGKVVGLKKKSSRKSVREF